MIDRKETLRDQIATIVQAGYSERKTSVETADEIIELILKPRKERDVTRICPECGRNVDEFGDCYHREDQNHEPKN